jgi:hypothetical protein
MATMMMSDATRSQGSSREISQPPNSSVNTMSTLPKLPDQAYILDNVSSRPATELPTGYIVFKEGHSAYFDPEFWPVLISEVVRDFSIVGRARY